MLIIVFLLSGALIVVCAGCGNKNLANVQKQINAKPADICGTTKEISSSNSLANELKSILDEACGEAKLTEDIKQDSPTEGTLVYVLKNKPAADKLKSAFKKHGYKIEISGESLIAAKGKTIFNISWTEEANCQKISVRITNGQNKSGGAVTVGECAELFAMAPKIDLRYNNLPAAYPWTLKFYDKMAVLEKKYGITQDDLSKACKAKSIEPGFMEKVEKQKQELNLN